MLAEDESKKRWLEAKEIVKNELIIDRSQTLTLGEYYTSALFSDIKHLTMSWSRYKFISKLFRYEKNNSILELGCNEGLGALFFSQNSGVNKFLGVDFDTAAIDWAKTNIENDNIQFCEDNFLNKNYGKFDVVISIDVIEHIEDEKSFIETICKNLDKNGVAVIGTPNITMTPYASAASKKDHINLFDQQRLWSVCKDYFQNVFVFNMTDEVIHTGFDPMSCYMFALCVNKIE